MTLGLDQAGIASAKSLDQLNSPGSRTTRVGSGLTMNAMNLADDLRKLANLRAEGILSDREFAEAKARLIAGPAAEPARLPPPGPPRVAVVPAIEPKTYWSSRWSAGNLFFRDRLTLGSDGITFRKGAMFSSNEEHINYRAVASFKTRNGIFLSNVSIETSGGSQPIFINGLWKSDAKEIQDVIRVFQERG